MKDDFYVPIQLVALEEQLKAHKPYAALSISTTGLNSAAFKEHSPIRVCVKQFAYNESTMEYEPTEFAFDKLVACSRQALERAVENADKEENPYDTFFYAGVNRDDYIKGEGVLSVEDFKRDFELYLDGIRKDTLLIINGGYSFAKDSLSVIGCMDKLDELKAERKIDDLLPLSKQYFQKRGVGFSGGAPRLEELNALVCDKDVSSAERIVGTDRRVDAISNFVIRYAKDEKFIEGESWNKFYKKQEAQMLEAMSINGRRDYESKNFTEKIKALTDIKKGGKTVIDPEAVMDINSDSDISVLLRTFRGQEDKKGFIVMQASTTGFDRKASTLSGRIGEPIQFAAVAYDFDNGKLKKAGVTAFNIKASNEAIAKAQAVAENGNFDAFGYAGININDYLANKKVLSVDKAAEKLNDFFNKFSPKEYALVSNGRQSSGRLFTQEAISQIASIEAVTAPCIDFTQAIKDYCYLAHENFKEYPKNVLVDAEKFTEKDFGLDSIAIHTTGASLASTQQRCSFTILCMEKLLAQQKELFADKFVQRPEPQDEKTVEIIKQEKPEQNIPEEPVITETEPAEDEPQQEEIPESEPEEKEQEPEPKRYERPDRYENGMDENEPIRHGRMANIHRPRRIPRQDAEESYPYGNAYPDLRNEVKDLIAALNQTNELNKTLVNQITVQNERIAAQGEFMNNVTDKLFGIITEESEVMRSVIQITEGKEEPKKLNERLDLLKDKIDEVRKEVKDAKVRETLTEANNAIAKGQRIMDDPEKKKDD